MKNIKENLSDFYDLYDKVEKLNIDSSIRCLTVNEMHVINILGKKTVTIKELASKLELTISTTSLAISKLEKKQFIFRKKDEKDKRKVYVKLTKKGEIAFDYHGNFNKDLFKNIIQDIDREKMKIFSDVLKKMILNLYNIKKRIEPIALYKFEENDVVIVDEVHANDAILNYLIDKKITLGKQLEIKEKCKNYMILIVDKEEKTLSREDCLCIQCIKKESK